jgi:predicted TIM-barrel fold metal-dependent hydrolase
VTTRDHEPFTDAHVHFWDHAVAGLRWAFLEPGFEHPRLKEMSRLDAPRYTGIALRREAGPAAPARVVHVQCAQAGDPTAETRWLDRIAGEEGWPDALVAGARIGDAGAAAAIVENAACTRVRGVRDLSVEDVPAPRDVAPALDAAAAGGVSVELMVRPDQYSRLAALASSWPTVTFVLGHGGQPLTRTPHALASWRAALSELAAAVPNVVVKVSAIASSADPSWTVDSIRPWVLAPVEVVGAERCMLATNWPIDRLYGTYERLVAAYRTIVDELDRAERRALWHGTASRVYRLEGGTTP